MNALYFLPFSVFSGLVIAPFYVIWSCINIFRNRLKAFQNSNTLVALVIGFLLISNLFAKVSPGSIMSITIIASFFYLKVPHVKLSYKKVLYLFLLYILLISIEQFSNGVITNFVRMNILNKTRNFLLSDLNRSYSFAMLCLWPLCSYVFNKNKALAVVLFASFVTLTFFSDAETILVAALFSAVVFFITSVKFFRNNYFYFVGFGSALVLVFITLYVPDNSYPLTIIQRFDIWHSVINYMMQNPFNMILGMGFDYSRYASNELNMLLPLHPHNHLLQIIFETGVIGLTLYFYLLWKLICKHNNDRVFLAMFAAYYVVSLMSYGIWQQWWMCAQYLSYQLYLNIKA